MEIGHIFDPEHGYSGSAHTTKEHRPHIKGYKHGQMVGHKIPKSEMPNMTQNEDGTIEAQPVTNMNHGGLSHIKSHHKNYSHGGKVEHDGHPKYDGHSHYDKHGFEIHHTHKGHKE